MKRINNLDEMFAASSEVTAKAAKRVRDDNRKEHAVTRETSAKAAKRVRDDNRKEHAITRETTAKAAKRVRDDNRAQHGTTRQHITDQHSATQDVVRREAQATRDALDRVRDYMDAIEIIIGAIFGLIAGAAMWWFEKDIITKPIAFDAAGNVTAYGTDIFMVAVLAVALAAFVFWAVSATVHAIRHRA